MIHSVNYYEKRVISSDLCQYSGEREFDEHWKCLNK